MKEEASRRRRRLRNLSGRLGKKEEDRECGQVYVGEGEEGEIIRGIFCQTEAPASSTCSDIVLTTIPTPPAIVMRFVPVRL